MSFVPLNGLLSKQAVGTPLVPSIMDLQFSESPTGWVCHCSFSFFFLVANCTSSTWEALMEVLLNILLFLNILLKKKRKTPNFQMCTSLCPITCKAGQDTTWTEELQADPIMFPTVASVITKEFTSPYCLKKCHKTSYTYKIWTVFFFFPLMLYIYMFVKIGLR